MKLRLIAVVLLMSAIGACLPTGLSVNQSPRPYTAEDVRVDRPSDVAWGARGIAVVVRDPEEPDLRTSLALVDPTTLRSEVLPKDRSGCDSSSVFAPQFAGDNLRYGRFFYPPGLEGAILEEAPGGDLTRLVDGLTFPPNAFVHVAASDVWLASDASGFCAWIERVAGEGGPWPITVDAKGRSFEVNESRIADDCDKTGHASRIAMAADGTLAFLASPSSVDVSGTARFDVDWGVYVVSEDGQSEQIAAGFQRPTHLRWHPDGRSFLVSARRGLLSGIWSVTLDGHVSLLYEADVISFDVAPDGERLALVIGTGEPAKREHHLIVVTPTDAASPSAHVTFSDAD
jgi:hypothetical protein